MFQQLYTDTIMSRFIKGLLSTTRLPLMDIVEVGDYIFPNRIYLYKNTIIRGENYTAFNPSNTRDYTVISYYSDTVNEKSTYNYVSRYNYYDGDTHYHLGQYLRFLKASKGLNLMPYYNCNIGKTLGDVELHPQDAVTNVSYSEVEKTSYKVVAVPVKFGRTYTIAIDCPTVVRMRGVFYGEHGLLTNPNDFKGLSDALEPSYREFQGMRFDHPVTYSIDIDKCLGVARNSTGPYIADRQKYLYLVIQLPIENSSSIVVLEGDYTNHRRTFSAIQCGGNEESNERVFASNLYNLSLLQMNSRESFAFSDRLIEYLLSNVITDDDSATDNVQRVQEALGSRNIGYAADIKDNKVSMGVWDDGIPHSITSMVEEKHHSIYMRDMDGNVNKDVEEMMMKEGDGY